MGEKLKRKHQSKQYNTNVSGPRPNCQKEEKKKARRVMKGGFLKRRA